MAESVRCPVCAKSFYGFPGDNCGPCEVIVRAWTARGFLELCRYLEKVTKFEAYEAQRESGDGQSKALPSEAPPRSDPAPAEDE